MPEVRTALSPYQLHQQKWEDGCGSSICDRAQFRCFARGDIPCDVLFCGEAPGNTEDTLGRPFCGEAGRLLDSMTKRLVLPENCKVLSITHPAAILRGPIATKGLSVQRCVVAISTALEELE